MTNTETKSNLLTDDQGHPSSMRLMSILALLAAIAFGWVDVNNNNPTPYVTFGFLLAAFAPKVLQKYIEQIMPKA